MIDHAHEVTQSSWRLISDPILIVLLLSTPPGSPLTGVLDALGVTILRTLDPLIVLPDLCITAQ
jgi:hypothetical protein